MGFYHAVIVGALYEFGDDVDAYSQSSYYQPLRQCIDEHAYLRVAIGDAHTDKAFYHHVLDIHLEQHVVIADHITSDNLSGIQKVLADDLDKPFPSGVPPWRITVLPLRTGCFIAFSLLTFYWRWLDRGGVPPYVSERIQQVSNTLTNGRSLGQNTSKAATSTV